MKSSYRHGTEDEVVGRIIESTIFNARCEFTESVDVGDMVYFKLKNDEILARVDLVETSPFYGLNGWIVFMERTPRSPKHMTPIYTTEVDTTGILNVGTDYRGRPIKISVNPLFNHLGLFGMTQRGKTHAMIVLIEELAKRGAPCLVIDPQGEFVNIPEKFKNVVVVENIETSDLIAYLQQHMIVIVNLLGLPNFFKSKRAGEILELFKLEKDKDYKQAEDDYRLLEIPPTLIFIDEADLFAPNRVEKYTYGGTIETVIDIAKRGAKMGMGLVLSTQRLYALHIDARDNCNSIMAFKTVSKSNKMALSQMPFVSKGTLTRVKNLLKGECIMLGDIIFGSRTVRVRDIETRRAKKVDFEEILGIKSVEEEEEEAPPSIVIDTEGAVVDRDISRVIETRKERTLREDQEHFKGDSGDGVVLREEELPEELVEELQKLNESELPFETHISEEEQKILKKLRKGDDRVIG